MKTAVSWLAEQLKKQGFLYDLDIEAAKQMEKEQIIEAFGTKKIEYIFNKVKGYESYNQTSHLITGEEYYNQTYN